MVKAHENDSNGQQLMALEETIQFIGSNINTHSCIRKLEENNFDHVTKILTYAHGPLHQKRILLGILLIIKISYSTSYINKSKLLTELVAFKLPNENKSTSTPRKILSKKHNQLSGIQKKKY